MSTISLKCFLKGNFLRRHLLKITSAKFLLFFLSFQEDELDYKEIVFKLNWAQNPARPVAPTIVKVRWASKDLTEKMTHPLFYQANFDDADRQKDFVPVHYRGFVELLESKMAPKNSKYIPIQEEFTKDRSR